MKEKELEIEVSGIFLGYIEKENQFIGLTFGTSMNNDKLVDLKDFTTYPKSEYKVKRGIIQYDMFYLKRIINLSYLLQIFGYQKINYRDLVQFINQLTPEFILELIQNNKHKIDDKTMTYLSEIYYLLNFDVQHQKGEKLSCQEYNKIFMLGV